MEGSAKIPLVINAPRRFELAQQQSSDLPVTHMDLMPTFLEMAGLDIPATVEGRSLVPILKDDQPRDPWREYVHGEHARDWMPQGGCQYLVSSREKYTWYTRSGRELLFNLDDDPQECVNLADRPEGAERLDYWRKRLVEELAKRPQDGLTDGRKLLPGKALPDVRPQLLEPYFDSEGRPRPGREVSRFSEPDEPYYDGRAWPQRL